MDDQATVPGAQLGLGCSNFGSFAPEPEALGIVDAALDSGVEYFDTSDAYPPNHQGLSEEILGRCLEGRRDGVRIGTKFGFNFGLATGRADRDTVRASIEGSLRRLRTDRIDLYQMHRPDDVTPIAETIGALDELRTEGRILAYGCSNFTGNRLREAAEAADTLGAGRFASNQVECSVVAPHGDVTEVCRELGVSVIGYFVLASGLLTGKYRKGAAAPENTRLTVRTDDPVVRRFSDRFPREPYLDAVEALLAYAEERGHRLPELALGWAATNPAVGTVLVGASNAAQLRQSAGHFRAWRPSPAEVAEIEAIVRRELPEGPPKAAGVGTQGRPTMRDKD